VNWVQDAIACWLELWTVFVHILGLRSSDNNLYWLMHPAPKTHHPNKHVITPTKHHSLPPTFSSTMVVTQEIRKKYSGSIDVDSTSRSFMRRSLSRISMHRTMSKADAASKEIGSTATTPAYGKPLSFASDNPMFQGGVVDGPHQKKEATQLARGRGAKSPRAKAGRGGKAAKTKKPLTTEFGSLERSDNRPIVYAVPAWCMVMPAARAAKDEVETEPTTERAAVEPEAELSVADSLDAHSEAGEFKERSKKPAPFDVRPKAKKVGSFARFFSRKHKKGKGKGKDTNE
jgi:hypothetical protein